MKPIRYLCARCGERWSAYAPAQRHANESKHSRIEMSETKLGETK